MQQLKKLKQTVKPVTENNPFVQWQNEYSKSFTDYLNSFGNLRDKVEEQIFFGIWSNPFVQKILGYISTKPRYTPGEVGLNYDSLMNNYKKQVAGYFPVKDEVNALLRTVALLL